MGFSPIYIKHVLAKSYKHWAAAFLNEFKQQNRAHLVMLARQGIIDSETATALKKSMSELDSTLEIPEEFPAGVEDLFFYYEKQLGNLLGEKAGSLHTARSRNDMDTTVFRLYVRKLMISLIEQMLKLAGALIEKIKGSEDQLLVLYTHGQPAQASTLAHYLSSFMLEFLEGLEGLNASLRVVNQCPLGAAAITSTGFDIDRQLVSDLLGFEKPVPNSYQAIVTSHWLTYPSMWFKSILNDITRLMADMGHKASCEVGMLSFPDELVQVSSIMPQKRNPVIIEHIRIQSGMAAGDFQSLIDLFHNVPYQDVNEVADAPVTNFTRGCETLSGLLELLQEMLLKVSVDEQRVDEIALSTGATTTELADELVRREGISFRTAHGVTSAFVKSGYSLEALRRRFLELVGRALKMADQELKTVLSPRHFVQIRSIPGGPSISGMESVVDLMEENLKLITHSLNGLNKKVIESEECLSREFNSLG
jgi:argininosuccinate lyase